VTDAATVTIQTPPTARDDRYATTANSRLVVEAPGLLANDSDPDGDTLTVDQTPVAGSDFGTVQLRANGSFAFVPPANETGSAQFTYGIRDGEGGTDTASVLVEVRDDSDGGDETADNETDQGGDGEQNQTDQGEDGSDETDQGGGGEETQTEQAQDGENQTDQDGSGDLIDPAGGGGGGDASVGVTRSSADGGIGSVDQPPSPTPSPTATPDQTTTSTPTVNSPSTATVATAPEGEDAAASAPETTNRDSAEQVIEVGGFGGGLPILVGGAVSLGFLGAVWLWRQY
jgi:hypothetical protein